MNGSKNTVMVTGANGFLGRHLVEILADTGFQVIAAVRRVGNCNYSERIKVVTGCCLDENCDWSEALNKIDVIVHAAARVHQMKETAPDSLAAYRLVNVSGTLRLARQAIDAGVKRFIYISSVKVNGESTLPGAPFRSSDVPCPADPYGVSKLEAEQALLKLSSISNMEVVIIRPTLIYGPGVGANFKSLIKFVERGYPLPFAKLDNRRSLVSIYNLVDLVAECITNKNAPGKVFMISDDHDVSISELITLISMALNVNPKLIHIPVSIMRSVLVLMGKKEYFRRIFGSLQVDITETKNTLNWNPKVSIKEAIKRTIAPVI